MSALYPDQTVLHYRVLASLGQGGMGEVYKALDTRLGRTVALKVWRSDAAIDADTRLRLLQEARAASALNHPNIVTVHAIESHGDLDFIVMEYLNGSSLQALASSGALSYPDVLAAGLQAADALAAAHAAGIIHRDIKPANIIVTANGHAKLVDFGLAKSMPRSAGEDASTLIALTSPGTAVGTVAYMSPEQTRGEALDDRTDVFSLGCVLYEAATGRRPFESPSLLGTLHAVATLNPMPPSRINPALPEEFDRLLEGLLAKERDRRPTAAQAASALRALSGHDPTAGRRDRSAQAEEEGRNFVGRERELARLEGLLEDARAGTGHIVFLTGEPGIGKTELADTFVRRSRSQAPLLLTARGRCVEQYGTGEAYLPFLDALSTLLAGPGGPRVASLLRSHAPTWCLQLPAAFASSSGSLEQLQRETIGATKERMLRELGDALGALTSSMPVLLLLEDLHWADPPSIDLLRHLHQRLAGQRLLIVGTFRLEEIERGSHPLKRYRVEMLAHGLCEEISLESLGIDHVATYLNSRFSPNTFPSSFPALLHRRTDGHPLFTTSLVQFLLERGDIVRVDDVWTLLRSLDESDLQAPEGVRSIIRKKIEALKPEDQLALQYASIEGEEFRSTLLAGLLNVDDLELEERLDRLDKVHRVIRTLGEEELPDRSLTMRYRFAHALYQNVLYQDLVSKRRIALHRQAGALLARLYRGQEARVAMQLATHFERGRDFAAAVAHYTQAGDNAFRIYANAEAEQHYSHALALLEKLPADERAEREMLLRQKQGAVHLALSRFDHAATHFRKLEELARAANAASIEAAALIGHTQVLFYSHRLDEMVAYAGEAMKAADRVGSDALRAETMAVVGLKQLCYGELSDAAPLLQQTIALARRINHRPPLAAALAWRGALHYWQSEYREAEALLVEAKAMASDLRDGFLLLFSLFILGLTQGNLGRMSDALDTVEEAARMASRNGDHFWFPRLPNCLGWIYRELQDFARAREHDERGLEVGRAHGVLEAQANSLINLGIDYTHAGERDRTLPAFSEVEEIFARDAWFRWRYNIRLHAALAEHWLANGDLSQAEHYARLLDETAGAYRAVKYNAAAHHLLARVAIGRGDTNIASEHLTAALDLLSSRPAPLVGWRVWSALGELREQHGPAARAREAFEEAGRILTGIAGEVRDPDLRGTFLGSPAVRNVLGRLEEIQPR